MNESTTFRNWEYAAVAIVAVAATLLLFAKLGDCYLWQDEAQTALISETVMHRGLPYGTDGTNFFSQEDGAEYGKDYIWKWHTWLQFYVVAASFAVFGVNTFAARLPFAIMGVGTVIATYFLARKVTGSRRAALFTAVLLTICVPFLLLSRQCRYYSATALFSTLGMLSYLQLVERKKFAWVFFIASATLLFQSHYVYCATLLTAVAIHAAMIHRDRLKAVLIACAVVALLNLPWALWLMGMKYGERYGGTAFHLGHAMGFLAAYLGYIAQFLFRPWLLVVPILVLVIYLVRKKTLPIFMEVGFRRKMLLPIIFAVVTLAVLCLSIPDSYFRYLAPLIPVFCLLAGCVAECAAQVHVAFGIVIVCLLAWFSPLRDDVYEIIHANRGPLKAVCTYLNDNAKPGDVVAISYGDMTLKFYTRLKVVGSLSGEPASEADGAKWIVIRKYVDSDRDRTFREYLIRLVLQVPGRFQRHALDALEDPYENSEDPRMHRFRANPDESRVAIF